MPYHLYLNLGEKIILYVYIKYVRTVMRRRKSYTNVRTKMYMCEREKYERKKKFIFFIILTKNKRGG